MRNTILRLKQHSASRRELTHLLWSGLQAYHNAFTLPNWLILGAVNTIKCPCGRCGLVWRSHTHTANPSWFLCISYILALLGALTSCYVAIGVLCLGVLERVVKSQPTYYLLGYYIISPLWFVVYLAVAAPFLTLMGMLYVTYIIYTVMSSSTFVAGALVSILWLDNPWLVCSVVVVGALLDAYMRSRRQRDTDSKMGVLMLQNMRLQDQVSRASRRLRRGRITRSGARFKIILTTHQKTPLAP